MVYYITYISTANENTSLNGLKALLDKSRTFNSQEGITGLLLYVEGDFIQTIEGKFEKVLNLYSKILKDKRHSNPIKVADGHTEERQFKEWSMSGVSLSYKKICEIDGFKSYNREVIFNTGESEEKHPAVKIMNAITPRLNSYSRI